MFISLSFDSDITALAGHRYGYSVYKVQVQPYLDKNINSIKIKFPENITNIADSFIQGFFKDIVRLFDKKAVIIESDKNISEKIYKSIWD